MGIFGLLRPSRIIRNKAIWSGLLGNSRPWRMVAYVLMAREALRFLSGAGAEVVDVATFGSGRNMEIATAKPLSTKRARRLIREGRLLSLREQRAEALVWAKKVAPKEQRASRRLFGRISSTAR